MIYGSHVSCNGAIVLATCYSLLVDAWKENSSKFLNLPHFSGSRFYKKYKKKQKLHLVNPQNVLFTFHAPFSYKDN